MRFLSESAMTPGASDGWRLKGAVARSQVGTNRYFAKMKIAMPLPCLLLIQANSG
jgi:hypothetical protein